MTDSTTNATPPPDDQAREPVTFDGRTTIDDVVAVAAGAVPVVTAATVDAIRRARDTVDRISATHPTYGRTTGVGANRTTDVSESGEHGMRLVRSHAADAGPALPHRTVRAMLAVRLAQLCVPGSGIAPEVLTALEAQIRADAVPRIGELGGIGTGDLTALAGAALALAGERSTSSPLPQRVFWDAGSALPFISSSALTIGRAALTVDRLRRVEMAVIATNALAVLALDGNPQAFSATAARAVAAPGIDEVCARLRHVLDGAASTPARIQDPYGLRILPITLAAAVTARTRLEEQLARLLTTAQENPGFDLEGGTVAHHGAFYQAQLALDLDAVDLALAQVATTLHALLRRTAEPDSTGLRPFLATGPAGASGLMMVEYAAAGALAELRAAASPASTGTISLSRGTEEDASFAAQGAVQFERAEGALRVVLGCTLLGIARLLDQRPRPVPARLEPAVRVLAGIVGPAEDHDLAPWIERAVASIDELAASVPALR